VRRLLSTALWAARGALRYARLTADLLLLDGRIPHPIYVCISVDFDLRYNVRPERGYEIVEQLFARFGLTGRATYFVNPRYWLGDESHLYRELQARGYEIGLHTHAEKLVLGEDVALGGLVQAQKATIERCFQRYDPAFTVRSFRSGSRAFSPLLFHALETAGIRYDSSRSHFERRRPVHGFMVDDAGTPGRVYYVEDGDSGAESPRPAALVEIPVTSHLPDLRRLRRSLRPGEPLVAATFVHPYNFHRNGRPAWHFILFYVLVLGLVTRIKGARFVHLAEAGNAWEHWYHEQIARGTDTEAQPEEEEAAAASAAAAPTG
jgi:hypothetical protein